MDRLVGHLVAVALTVLAVLTPVAAPRMPDSSAGGHSSADALVLAAVPAAGAVAQSEVLVLPASRPADVIGRDVFAAHHTMVEGESLGDVARRYGVSVASLVWANGLASDAVLAVGQDLRIPRVSGVPYVVQPDDTLASIAARLQVPMDAITLFRPNGVTRESALEVGQELFIPGGELEYPRELLDRVGGELGLATLRAVLVGSVYDDETNLREGPGRAYQRVAQLAAGARLIPVARHDDWVKVDAGAVGSGWVRSDLIAISQDMFAALPETNDFPPPPPRWVWPTYGQLTSPFGWRTAPYRSFHDGLDIANRAGTPIRAARAGQVYEAGWCRGFGYCVKIDHGGGVVTIYGHLLRRPLVSSGDIVEAGATIGAMGSTYDRAGGGYSTGVHLHFMVKVGGKAVNPLKYLP